MVTQTLRGVSTEITTTNTKWAISSCPTDRKGGCGVRGRVRGGEGGREYIPALIRASKGSVATLRPLVANQSMQSVALEPAPTTVINRLALPVLPSIHETAVYRLARTSEQQCKGRNAFVVDGWLHYVHLEPGRVPYVGLHQLSSVFGRYGGGP